MLAKRYWKRKWEIDKEQLKAAVFKIQPRNKNAGDEGEKFCPGGSMAKPRAAAGRGCRGR